MLRRCSLTNLEFSVSQAEAEYCLRNQIPLPSLAPDVRLKNILLFRNRHHLYNATCALSGKKILSMIPPESGLTVFDVEVWQSDKWDSLSYGLSYDFNRPFFDQYAQLIRSMPWANLALVYSMLENSDYTNGITGAKNCYLLFSASYNEDCMFSKYVNYSRNVVDSMQVIQSELCFECRFIQSGYNLKYCEMCQNCSDSAFLVQCNACRNCYGCVNLSNKEYHFFNQPLSKEEYERKVAEIDFGSFAAVQRERQRFMKFRSEFPIKYLYGRNFEESSGNFLTSTKHCKNSWYINDGEDLEHCIWVSKGKSSFFQCMFGNDSELVYNSHAVGDSAYNIKFCNDCWQSVSDLEYCMNTMLGSNNCFGCFGLKKRSYCVLNKQYSKADYFELVERIKAQMRADGSYGQFFPINLSPHCYNRSDVFDFFPATREESLAQGYTWLEEETPTMSSINLPDHIDEVDDAILNQTLTCQISAKPFRIIRKELEFTVDIGSPFRE
jgi:hypothetical protein